MSVSFFASIEGNVVIPSFVECGCGSFRSQVFASRSEAYEAMTAGKVASTCADDYCVGMADLFVSDDEPEANLSNANAVEMLDYLGIQVGVEFSERCVGSLPAEDFKGRVLMAMALVPADEGVPAHKVGAGSEMAGFAGEMARAGHPNVWDCGRPAGYNQAKLGYLLEVAEYALEQGREVVWA